jgi:hypothetical protein
MSAPNTRATQPFRTRLSSVRVARRRNPSAIAAAAAARRRPPPLIEHDGGLLIIAADHPARGALGAGSDPLAMADRAGLLERICAALSREGVHGFLGAADLVEDLLLLGALEGKLVFGTMNRGGVYGSTFEFDDRFTAYDASALEAMRLDGGKMLLRIALDDPLTAATLEGCAHAVSELASRRLPALIEPFLSTRVDGRVQHVLTADAEIRAVAISSALGSTSAYTWLKIPIVAELERVLGATTLPTLLLGGEVAAHEDAMYESWRSALSLRGVAGMVIGRSLLYPPSGDVADAVDVASRLVRDMPFSHAGPPRRAGAVDAARITSARAAPSASSPT